MSENKKEPTINLHLFLMWVDMFVINWMFHFTRNSPRNCYKFYYRLIATIGVENWDLIDNKIKGPWEEARKDFDKLYGLVKAWSFMKDSNGKRFKEIVLKQINEAKEAARKKKEEEEIQKKVEAKIKRKSIEEAISDYNNLGTTFDWQTADAETEKMKLQEEWLDARIKLIIKQKQLEEENGKIAEDNQ